MTSYEDEYKKYADDPRIACIYATKCYQKNQVHNEKYKHPPKRKNENNKMQTRPVKKQKLNEDNIKNKSTPENLAENPKKSKKNEIKISGNLEKFSSSYDSFENYKKFIKEHFLMEMPPDFYEFWNFCCKLKPADPANALNVIGLMLVGPYDVLLGNFDEADKTNEEYLIHWRYLYDPPEMQTVLKGSNQTGFHIGYFRDDPDQPPSLMVNNYAMKDGILNKMGDNIFAAVYIHLDTVRKSVNPFTKMQVSKLAEQIKSEAERLHLDVTVKSEKIKARQSKAVARTLNTIGLVVPYDKKTQLGYRELTMPDKELRSLLTKMQNSEPEQKNGFLKQLQPVLTYASIALDECDFGTGVELGWDIISFDIEYLNNTALQFLKQSYGFLNREAFARIAEAHLTNRKKGCLLSVLK